MQVLARGHDSADHLSGVVDVKASLEEPLAGRLTRLDKSGPAYRRVLVLSSLEMTHPQRVRTSIDLRRAPHGVFRAVSDVFAIT
jgi:hypothetical protein